VRTLWTFGRKSKKVPEELRNNASFISNLGRQLTFNEIWTLLEVRKQARKDTVTLKEPAIEKEVVEPAPKEGNDTMETALDDFEFDLFVRSLNQ